MVSLVHGKRLLLHYNTAIYSQNYEHRERAELEGIRTPGRRYASNRGRKCHPSGMTVFMVARHTLSSVRLKYL
jgi:hypothetical protein